MGSDLHPVNPNTELAIAAVVAAPDRACRKHIKICRLIVNRHIQDMIMWNAAGDTLNQSGYSMMVMSGME